MTEPLMLQRLVARCPELASEQAMIRIQDGTANTQEVLATLNMLVCHPSYTLPVGSCFKPCLLRLVSALVELHMQQSGAAGTAGQPVPGGVEAFSVALVTLLDLAPHIDRLVVRFFRKRPAPHTYVHAAPPVDDASAQQLPSHADMALASLAALQQVPELRQMWGSEGLLALLTHSDHVVRWAGVRALSLQLGLNDAASTSLEGSHLDVQQAVAAVSAWRARHTRVGLEQSAAWMPRGATAESTATGSSHATLSLPPARAYVDVCGIELPCREDSTASASTSAASAPTSKASKHSKLHSTSGPEHVFVATPSATRNLRAAALALCAARPLLLEGPPGCGKTRMAEELAIRTHNAASMVRIHLDDQMDAKALLGAYVCGAVPGEFLWQPGPLSQAVVEGRWVLIEDINMAPADVLAALVPLLESRTLTVASRGEVLHAAPGFQVLATVTSAPHVSGAAAGGAYATSNMAKELLGGLWAYVRMEPATEHEQLAMLAAAFPLATPLLPAAIAALDLVHIAAGHGRVHGRSASIPGGPGQGGVVEPHAWWHVAAAAALSAAGIKQGELALSLGRHFSVRDVFKWAGRMCAMHGQLLGTRSLQPLTRSAQALLASMEPNAQVTAAAPSSADYDITTAEIGLREAAFMEAADLFAALVPKPGPRASLLRALAALWGLPAANAAETYDQLRKPQLHEAQLEVVVGRAVVERRPADSEGVALFGEGTSKVKTKARKGSAGQGEEGAEQQASTSGAGAGLGTFARTGHSMRMMERVACALSRAEPVLLVGETGTGKTTLVSRLAAMARAPLVAFNMSQQTDSSDLLGGFKPVEARDALLPLLQPFVQLVRATWTKGNNEEFLLRTAKYAEKKKWTHLLQAFKTALGKVAAVADVGVQAPSTSTAATAEDPADASAPTAGAEEGKERKKKSGKKGEQKGKEGSAEAAAGDTPMGEAAPQPQDGPALKKRRTAGGADGANLGEEMRGKWRAFASELATAERAATVAEGGFAFSFVEGKLVQALREGWWLLLDEINLAPPEVLERIAGLLEGAHGSITLVERGDTHTVPRHPGFRLVAAMNPATDAGKRELPAPLRNRFTEVWVPEPSSKEDLRTLVAGYLASVTVPIGGGAGNGVPGGLGAGGAGAVDACVELYLAAKAEAEVRLMDGAGARPAYSLRTLCRALDYARSAAPHYGLQRALYDGFAMAFATQLAPDHEPRVEALLHHFLINPPAGGAAAVPPPAAPTAASLKALKALMRTPAEPAGGNHVLFEKAFWLERGSVPLPVGGQEDDGGGAGRKFVLTPSVRRQMNNLARAVLVRKHPILLQGPTSSGKTSLVAYLAAHTGHALVRINNHEHTDLQEYLGSYVSTPSGRLVFKEGALVTAMRAGAWVVLDELNLAPSEVLEALNRLLDDNRELFVPELNEVVKPHPHFMLFATQNPPGAYAGRKVLSRAFRSRFLELHVEELPDTELAEILEKRCAIAPSYATKLVAVMRELQRRRQATNVFAGRHGFITPRDLFRWAERHAVGYQALAEDGALILGERLRAEEERVMVREVLAKLLNVTLDIESVFSRDGDAPFHQLRAALGISTAGSTAAAGPEGAAAATAALAAMGEEELEALRKSLRGVVWTRSMARMYTLVERCVRHMEPVLLVGETGVGKTTVVQAVALMRGQRLHTINVNQHTEAADLIGGFRPARGRSRALAAFAAAANRVVESQLLAAASVAAPIIPAAPGMSEVMGLVAALQAAAGAADKWVDAQQTEIQAQLEQAPNKAKKKAQAQLQLHADQLAALQADVAAAAEAAGTACAPFVWVDGPLVTAMRTGDIVLIDEINLAEDAVLERLNSVLEPGRTLTLAERGGEGAEVVVAAPGFRVLATMNPGGDYGKKELSPALANRFTTVWVPSLEDVAELGAILEARLATDELRSEVAPRLLQFWSFFRADIAPAARTPLSVRDLLAWANFINAAAPALGALPAYAQGAHLTLLDGLGLGSGVQPAAASLLRQQCAAFLRSQLPADMQAHARLAEGDLHAAAIVQSLTGVPDAPEQGSTSGQLVAGRHASVGSASDQQQRWGIHPFYVPVVGGPGEGKPKKASKHDAGSREGGKDTAGPQDGGTAGGAGAAFELSGAPTAARNAFRVLRALALPKAVLLEGSPGVGKTALIAALARRAGVALVRINLSEQTDMMDLLGADLPAPGGAPGQFEWCDGPLLGALKRGAWVLLDELNLANQSVLEGLNALLDHRAEVFIPELCATYRCHPSFRLFAAQNPLQEGGGRKGLPKSFLNRFTRVACELLGSEDLTAIASSLYTRLPRDLLVRMVHLLGAMDAAANGPNAAGAAHGAPEVQALVQTAPGQQGARFAAQGGPWEFNLRDLLRWAELTESALPSSSCEQSPAASSADGTDELACLDAAAESYAHMLFSQRLRTAADRARFLQLFQLAWGRAPRIGSLSAPASADGQQGGSTGVPAGTQPDVPLVLGRDVALIGRSLIQRASTTHAANDTPSQANGSDAHMVNGAEQQEEEEEEEEHDNDVQLQAQAEGTASTNADTEELAVLRWQLPLLESMCCSLSRGWMALLVGGPGSGKTRLARLAARLAGRRLTVVPLTSGTDTSDLLGSFEQVEPGRRVRAAAARVHHEVDRTTRHLLLATSTASQSHTSSSVALSTYAALTHCRGLQAAWHAYCDLVHHDRESGLDATPESHGRQVAALQHALAVCQAAADLPGLHTDVASLRRLQRTGTLLTSLAALVSDESSRAVAGRFEWVDGVLARAIAHGGWVLLDNANLCNPTVMDRLNPLLEPGGVLFMAECGSVGGQPRVITPHPDFRLILAMDPRHGEVSRAMRNRGIELFLLPPPAPPAALTLPPSESDAVAKPTAAAVAKHAAESQVSTDVITPLTSPTSMDTGAWAVLSAAGAAAGGPDVLAALAAVHTHVSALATAAHRKPPTLSDLGAWAGLTVRLLARGWELGTALKEAWDLAYLGGQVLGVSELAAAQRAYMKMCSMLPVLRTSASDAPDTVSKMETDEEGEEEGGPDAAGAKKAEDVEVSNRLDAGPLQLHLDLSNTIPSAAIAAAQRGGQASSDGDDLATAPIAAARPMAIPCLWPTLLGGSSLASHSLFSQVERDGAPIAAALFTALAAVMAQAHGEPGQDAAVVAARSLPLANRHQLAMLPATITATFLHGPPAASAPPSSSADAPHASIPDACFAAALQAAEVFVLRSLESDVHVRGAWVQDLSQQVGALSQLLGDAKPTASVAALASLSAQCVTQLLSHSLTASLRAARTARLTASGSAGAVLQPLQPLDPRYSHVAVAATAWAPNTTAPAVSGLTVLGAAAPSATEAAWLLSTSEQGLLSQWQALAVAVPQAALQQHVAQAADVMVGAGTASAYQMSRWRASRPEERALRDPPHPLVDVLAPAFGTITDLEAELISLPQTSHTSTSPLSAPEWSEDVAGALSKVAHWRAALWDASHGPVHQARAASSASTSHALLDEEQVTWVWRQLDKALARLEAVLPQLGPTPLGARLSHMRASGATALGLDSAPAKPLLWRLGGRPLLPRAHALLRTRLQAAAIVRACAAVAGGAGQAAGVVPLGAVDARGFPAALGACGLDAVALIDGLMDEVGADGINQLVEGGAALARTRVSSAVASTLVVDAQLRRAAAQGLAMVAFAPVTLAVRVQSGSNEGSASAASSSSAASFQAEAELISNGEQVVEGLRDAIVRRATAAAKEAAALEGKTHADSLAVMNASLASLFTPAPPAKAGAKGRGASTGASAAAAPVALLLPPGLMASPACRRLQGGLLVLQDLHSIRAQLPLLATATSTLAVWTAQRVASSCSAPGSAIAQSPSPIDCAPVARMLLTAVKAHLEHGVAASGRSPADFAGHQQLVWVLDMVASWPSTASRAAASSQAAHARQWQYLQTSVLPALLHELWLSWQAALWNNTASVGSLLQGRPVDASKQGLDLANTQSISDVPPARLLHTCSRTSAAVALVTDVANEVQARGVRLAQLRAAAAHLVTASSASGSQAGQGACAPAAQQHVQATWVALAGLLSQLLLAHTSSLPSPAAAQHLGALVRQVLMAVSEPGSLASSTDNLVAGVGAVLRTTSHSVLAAVTEVLLVPVLEAILVGSHAQSVQPAAEVMAAQGACWALLGAARMQLAAPPAGIDPAGKYALKARHLRERVLLGTLGPQHAVRSALRALPGGPEEGPILSQIATQRTSVHAAYTAALAHCVPRPQPPQYVALAGEVRGFLSGLGALERVVGMVKALQASSSPAAPEPVLVTKAKGARGNKAKGGAVTQPPPGAAAAAAAQEATVWVANAGAWVNRLGQQYTQYLDIVQPVQLAVQEVRHGLSLLSAAAPVLAASAAAADTEATASSGPAPEQLASAVVSSLLSFPLALSTQPASNTSATVPLTAFGGDVDPHAAAGQGAGAASLLCEVAAAGTRQALAHLEPTRVTRAADMAGYTARMQAGRVALHALARQLLAVGSAALSSLSPSTAATQASGAEGSSQGISAPVALGQLESLLAQFVAQWSALKAYEEKVAAEEEVMFKTKARTINIMNEEEEAELDYHKQFPGSITDPFNDLMDEEKGDLMDEDKPAPPPVAEGEDGEASSEAQAKSTAARQLLDGEVLADIVHLHAAVFTALVAYTSAAAPATVPGTQAAAAADPDASQTVFLLGYQLGSDLLTALGPGAPALLPAHAPAPSVSAQSAASGLPQHMLLGREVDDSTLTGHLYRLCLEYERLAKLAAATAADAATAAEATNARGGLRGSSKKAKKGSADQEDGVDLDSGFFDIQSPFVEEVVLLQEPVAGVSRRLAELLAEWPEHPVLMQLAAICGRCLSLPITAPLKTALTGLELLLARAQLWEETAASHVTLKAQLGPVAALATRWRKLELSSWRGTVRRVAVAHAAGANRSWFHLHQLLLQGGGAPWGESASGAAAEGGQEAPATASGQEEDGSTWYLRTASTLEAFLQTSTLGEYSGRLQLLRSFHAHILVRARLQGQQGTADADTPAGAATPGAWTPARKARALLSAISNTLLYYGQFEGAVRAAIVAGLAPHEKDLSDFVALAKWEDRGYYAMRSSTEKAQRHLHKLRRRAEDALKEPAGGVLAQAVKAMGVPEFAAAAQALQAAGQPAVPTPAGTQAAGNAAGAAPGAAAAKAPAVSLAARRALRKAKARKAKGPAASLLLTQAAGLEAEELEEEQLYDPVMSSANRQAWGGLCEAATAAAASGPEEPEAATVAGKWGSKLKQLPKRLGGVLSSALATDPTAWTDAPEAEEEEAAAAGSGSTGAGPASTELLPGALKVDELAAAAASRAAELKADISKGCKLRKRKALSDFLHALGELGLSKRASDVPHSERGVAAWFLHAPPELTALLQPTSLLQKASGSAGSMPAGAVACDAGALADASAAWAKSSAYYYRSVARMQKLMVAAPMAHKDVGLSESQACVNYCNHLLLMARRQRGTLNTMSTAHAAMAKLTSWLSGLSAAADGAAGEVMSQLPPQARGMHWMHAQQAQLASLQLLTSDTAQLLSACDATLSSVLLSSQSSALQSAKTACAGWQQQLSAARAALDACLASTTLDLPQGHGRSTSMHWVSASAWATLSSNYQLLQQLAQDAQSAAVPVSAQDAFVPPGLPQLAEALSRAATEAQAFASESSTGAPPATPQSDVSQALDAFASDLDATIASILVWAQSLAPATTPAPAAADGSAPKEAGLLEWQTKLSGATQAERAAAIAAAVSSLMHRAAALRDTLHASGSDSTAVAALSQMSRQLSGLAPMLALVAGGLQQQALRWVALHRACVKLAYVSSSIFATLLEEGFCAPEGEAVESKDGGDGPGEWKPQEGTGMGDGDTEGAKDVSDKITDEDQLLGAKQKDEPEEEQQQQKENNGQEEDDKTKGIEMEADFEGEMHDLDVDRQQGDDDDDDGEEGDEDRLDQQMGDTGDNDQVVDEKLWGDDEKEEKEKDGRREDTRDDGGTIEVDDKKDLEYRAGQEEPEEPDKGGKQDKKQKDDKSKQKKKEEAPAGGEAEEQQGMEEEEDGEEEGAGMDQDDNYADRQGDESHVKPDAPEEEMTLPEDLNLDGGEEEGEQEQGGEQEEAAVQQDPQGPPQETGDKEEGAEGAGDDEPAGKEEGGEDGGEEGGEEKPADAGPQGGEEGGEEDGAEPPGGIGQVVGPEPEGEGEDAKGEEDEKEAEPTAAHGTEEQQQKEQEQQQTGPRGVASAAAAAKPEGEAGKAKRGLAAAPQAASQRPAPKPTDQGDQGQKKKEQQQQQGAEEEEDDGMDTDPNPTAPRADTGYVRAAEKGAAAPLDTNAPGAQEQEQAGGQKARKQERPEPNPLRDLGDAMEKWKAGLSVNEEGQQGEEEEEEGVGKEEEDQGAEGADVTAPEYRFLGAGEQQQAGDTQALAPATAEQAHELEGEDGARRPQPQDEDAMDSEEGGQLPGQEGERVDEEEDGGEGGDASQAPVQGLAPKKWRGGQKQARVAGQAHREDGEEGKDGAGEEEGMDVDKLFETGEREEGDASFVMARLALNDAGAPGGREKGEDGEGAAGRRAGLTPEEADVLRKDLDEALRGGGAAAEAAARAQDPRASRYGAEVWSRCDALTAGLAGELAEQLRLILEPTLASRLAGDFRTGKRISMRKVIAYIASHYRKDKIWLRRSRPDKRRYQVLLAVDDSRSMAECGCGGVALEATTLLCKAMSRLEVGQIGVLKFGGSAGAVPLHPLGTPFSDAAGPGIMAGLRFDQDNTIADQPMMRMVEALDHMLDVARHAGGAGGIGAGTQDLAQLVLVVADGRLHEKEGLRARVRELAAKRGVCLAFIAIDPPAAIASAAGRTAGQGESAPAAPAAAPAGGSNSSLLDMQAVSFQNGKPVFRRYLDDFPFPYYVLLRDIAALPRTLADLLRQWFEISSAGSG